MPRSIGSAVGYPCGAGAPRVQGMHPYAYWYPLDLVYCSIPICVNLNPPDLPGFLPRGPPKSPVYRYTPDPTPPPDDLFLFTHTHTPALPSTSSTNPDAPGSSCRINPGIFLPPCTPVPPGSYPAPHQPCTRVLFGVYQVYRATSWLHGQGGVDGGQALWGQWQPGIPVYPTLIGIPAPGGPRGCRAGETHHQPTHTHTYALPTITPRATGQGSSSWWSSAPGGNQVYRVPGCQIGIPVYHAMWYTDPPPGSSSRGSTSSTSSRGQGQPALQAPMGHRTGAGTGGCRKNRP